MVNPPKAPLDIVDDALDELYWETANRPVKGIDENNTDELDVIMTHKRQIIDEAKVQIEAHIQREVRTAELRAKTELLKYLTSDEVSAKGVRASFLPENFDSIHSWPIMQEPAVIIPQRIIAQLDQEQQSKEQ